MSLRHLCKFLKNFFKLYLQSFLILFLQKNSFVWKKIKQEKNLSYYHLQKESSCFIIR